jgi:hypothetical protein
MSHPRVIAGLDPAIHPAKPKKIFDLMDARIKPAHDGVRRECCDPSAKDINR